MSEEEWAKIVGNWESLESNRPGWIMSMIEMHGVADSLRGPTWLILTNASNMKARNSTLYTKLLSMEVVPHEETIARDIPRTFARHQFFVDECGPGQLELFQVLRAYAAYDLEVGYCQGMGFLVAFLLCYMPAENAFWALVVLMQRTEYEFRQLFRPGMPKFHHAMYKLTLMLEKTEPDLARHFTQIGIESAMYASQWFMTLFAYNFPLKFVARVWDLFFAQGWSIIYRVAISLLRLNRSTLISQPFEGVMAHLRDIHKSVEVEEIISNALSLSLPEATPFAPL